MADFKEALDLEKLALKIILKRPEVSHVETNRILFLWEYETKPGNGTTTASTYKFGDHPIGFFTDKPYGIVFFERNMEYMNQNQRTLLMFHELMHIPENETLKLVQHDRKDFRVVLGIDLDWSLEGKLVPDILGGVKIEPRTKSDRIQTDNKRTKIIKRTVRPGK